MSAKIFLNSSTKYIPQMDMAVKYSDNQGVEGTQTFLARKADIGSGANLNLFTRGTRWELLYPEIPILFRNLTLKTFDPEDFSPGIVAIKATFTGYQYSASGGSSGEETTVPTSSLTGNLEEVALSELKKWTDLGDDEKWALGMLLAGQLVAKPGTMDDIGQYVATEAAYGVELTNYISAEYNTGSAITYSAAAKLLIRAIAQGRTTFKKGGWTYTYRTESKTGFTTGQLNSLGKIVANPPGSPVKPGAGWTWLLAGPSQEQSGQDRYIKSLDFLLIEDNDENQFFYGP